MDHHNKHINEPPSKEDNLKWYHEKRSHIAKLYTYIFLKTLTYIFLPQENFINSELNQKKAISLTIFNKWRIVGFNRESSIAVFLRTITYASTLYRGKTTNTLTCNWIRWRGSLDRTCGLMNNMLLTLIVDICVVYKHCTQSREPVRNYQTKLFDLKNLL